MDNDSEWIRVYRELCQKAARDCMELNNQYHTPEEIREIMFRLTGKTIDGTFRLYPPFYADFGKNIKFWKEVFINLRCHFKDQGGIEIGDWAWGDTDGYFGNTMTGEEFRPIFEAAVNAGLNLLVNDITLLICSTMIKSFH